MKPRLILLNAAALLALTTTWLFSQGGPLDPPPGPPSSNVYKTLDEVEARTPVDTAGTVITSPGSYYLTANIAGAPGQSGVTISASHVTLDLNGFTLDGGGATSGSLDGVTVSGARTGVVIRNGTVANWDSNGIEAGNASACLIEEIRVIDNGGDGIRMGNKGIMRRCSATGNGVDGLEALANGQILACNAGDNGDNGIEASEGSLVKDTVSNENTNNGFDIRDTRLSNCVAMDNGNVGMLINNNSTVQDCTVIRNTNGGLRAASRCRITGNHFESNGIGQNQPMILVTGSGSHLENNSLLDADIGMKVTDGENVILRNTSTRQVTHYDIVGGNIFGPIVTSANVATNDNPHANYQQ